MGGYHRPRHSPRIVVSTEHGWLPSSEAFTANSGIHRAWVVTIVRAERMTDLCLLAPLRSRKGETHPSRGEEEQHLLKRATDRAGGAGQLFDEVRRGDLGKLLSPRPVGIALQS